MYSLLTLDVVPRRRRRPVHLRWAPLLGRRSRGAGPRRAAHPLGARLGPASRRRPRGAARLEPGPLRPLTPCRGNALASTPSAPQ